MYKGRGGEDEVREVTGPGRVEPRKQCQNLGFYSECDVFASTMGRKAQGEVPYICSQTTLLHSPVLAPALLWLIRPLCR